MLPDEKYSFKDVCEKIDRIEGLLKGFLQSGPAQSPLLPAKPQPKFALPAGAGWADIVIKLAGSYALISIRRIMPKPRKVNFVELDCYDKLRKSRLNPDRHWRLLERLAEHDGELPWQKAGRTKRRWNPDGDEDDSESAELIGKSGIVMTDKYSAKEISRVKKTIQGLRQKLKAFFGLADDPFCPYEQVHTYKTKFQLKAYNPDEWKHDMEDDTDEDGSEPPPIPK
jgi:hypothetical protein